MADKSGIQWTDATWNPTTGCDRVSPGCANCYALNSAPRLKAMTIGRYEAELRDLIANPTPGRSVRLLATDPYMRDGDPATSGPGFGLMMHPSRLDQPLRWKRPRRIFVNSMSDLFHPEVTDAFLDEVWAVMALAPQHTFQVLTKRPERMRIYLSDRAMKDRMHAAAHALSEQYKLRLHQTLDWPLPNVWLGTSVENARWRSRIDELRHVPAAVRFLSCEPLLGPLTPRGDWVTIEAREVTAWDPSSRLTTLNLAGIDWVIIGGESGAKARPMNEAWVTDILDACRAQGVKPFVKQMGSVWAREHLGRESHAGYMEEWPEALQVRETP